MQLKSDLSFQRTYCRTDFDEKLYHSVLDNILSEIVVHVIQRFKKMGKFRFVGLLNPKHFTHMKKKFLLEAFST